MEKKSEKKTAGKKLSSSTISISARDVFCNHSEEAESKTSFNLRKIRSSLKKEIKAGVGHGISEKYADKISGIIDEADAGKLRAMILNAKYGRTDSWKKVPTHRKD